MATSKAESGPMMSDIIREVFHAIPQESQNKPPYLDNTLFYKIIPVDEQFLANLKIVVLDAALTAGVANVSSKPTGISAAYSTMVGFLRYDREKGLSPKICISKEYAPSLHPELSIQPTQFRLDILSSYKNPYISINPSIGINFDLRELRHLFYTCLPDGNLLFRSEDPLLDTDKICNVIRNSLVNQDKLVTSNA